MNNGDRIKKISQNPGVYIFKDKSGRILYIGKATNLRSRVSSYFRGLDLTLTLSLPTGRQAFKGEGNRDGRPVMSVLGKVVKIETRETESVLEALILESNLIKKHQPKYNVDLKDDKSFSYVVITKEEFPRVLIARESDLEEDKKQFKINNLKFKISESFGPYTSKKQLEIALKIIRKIFPYHSQKEKSEKGCLDFQIGLCPGPYADVISKVNYRKNIRGIKMILEGKKKGLIRRLEKEMEEYSKKQEFEKAGEIRNKVFALRHIRDVALISDEKPHPVPLSGTTSLLRKERGIRIEAYDISNISGQQAVGSMVVFEGGEPNKKEYRKFRIKTVEGANDVAMMAEVLFRRFQNTWPKPDLILLDGGKGHLNMIMKVLKELDIGTPLISVAKGKDRKGLEYQASKNSYLKEFSKILEDKKLVKRIMDEAHRFAIGYHRKIRDRQLLDKSQK